MSVPHFSVIFVVDKSMQHGKLVSIFVLILLNCLPWQLMDSGRKISERNACQQMRVAWVEVLSYEKEKNVAFGRSHREGIFTHETVKDIQRTRSKRKDSPSVNSGLNSRNLAKTNRIGCST